MHPSLRRFLVPALAVAGAIAVASIAHGQTVGVLAGSSLSGLHGGQGRNTEALLGVTAGATAELPISDHWRVRVGAIFTEKGAERPGPDGPSTTHLSYLELPLLAGVERSWSGWTGGLYAGPAFSFEIRCDRSQVNREVTFFSDCDRAGLDTRNLDVGVLFGGRGAYRVLPRVDLTLDILLNAGVTNIDDRIDSEATRNRAILLAGGISFHVGR